MSILREMDLRLLMAVRNELAKNPSRSQGLCILVLDLSPDPDLWLFVDDGQWNGRTWGTRLEAEQAMGVVNRSRGNPSMFHIGRHVATTEFGPVMTDPNDSRYLVLVPKGEPGVPQLMEAGVRIARLYHRPVKFVTPRAKITVIVNEHVNVVIAQQQWWATVNAGNKVLDLSDYAPPQAPVMHNPNASNVVLTGNLSTPNTDVRIDRRDGLPVGSGEQIMAHPTVTTTDGAPVSLPRLANRLLDIRSGSDEFRRLYENTPSPSCSACGGEGMVSLKGRWYSCPACQTLPAPKEVEVAKGDAAPARASRSLNV